MKIFNISTIFFRSLFFRIYRLCLRLASCFRRCFLGNFWTSFWGSSRIWVARLMGVCLFIPHISKAAEQDHPSEPVHILMLGDSLTAGYGLAARDVLPNQLEIFLEEAGVYVRIHNAGVSGDTTAGGLARLEWLLAEDFDAAIVALGGNDMLRGIAPQDTAENLEAIIQQLLAQDIPVFLSGMQASLNLDDTYRSRFNQIYPDLAAEYDIMLDPFLLEGVALNPDLHQADGIHPNLAGVQMISARLTPLIIDFLQTENLLAP